MIRMAQGHSQCAMPAHRMTHYPLPRHIDRKLRLDESRELLGDIGPHAEIGGPRFLRRIDVEARALTEIISLIVRDSLAARACIRSDKDQPELRAGTAILALFGDIGMGAGEAGQIPDDGQFAAL